MDIRVLKLSIWAFLNAVKLDHHDAMTILSALGRKEQDPRAQFMSLPELIAIFPNGLFWNGVKPLLIVLCFRKKIKPTKKIMKWRAVVGPFKNSR